MLVREPRREYESEEDFAKREVAYWKAVDEARNRVAARREKVARWRMEYGEVNKKAERV